MTREQQALGMVWSHRRFWLLNLFVCLVVTGSIVGWFWIPESSALAVISSVAGAAVLLLLALLWIAATFLYYSQPGVQSAVGIAMRRLPALLVWAALGSLLVWAIAPRVPWWVGWLFLPALLIPPGSAVSTLGFAGFMPAKWPLRFLRSYPGVAVCGVLVPVLLTRWHPALPGITLQTISLALRWGLAAVLVVTAWLFLAALLAIPEESRASTS
jgi:hypothetical protein